ncbi:hypothetical protein [Chitinibacter tainanensis]|uniref:hypothetical protein n=1 Tax=Chitinibacter tainanensis TaxID=230667 RepID=UPI00048F4215|nr:hypothetical protein [Chitinibacter tainanensis]
MDLPAFQFTQRLADNKKGAGNTGRLLLALNSCCISALTPIWHAVMPWVSALGWKWRAINWVEIKVLPNKVNLIDVLIRARPIAKVKQCARQSWRRAGRAIVGMARLYIPLFIK